MKASGTVRNPSEISLSGRRGPAPTADAPLGSFALPGFCVTTSEKTNSSVIFSLDHSRVLGRQDGGRTTMWTVGLDQVPDQVLVTARPGRQHIH